MKAKLLKYKVKGIRNLKEEICIDFSNDSIVNNKVQNIANIKGIYGFNGAGKSAIIESILLYKALCSYNNFVIQMPIVDFLNDFIAKPDTDTISFETYFGVFNNNSCDISTIYKHTINIKRDMHYGFTIANESLSILTGKSLNGEFYSLYETEDGRLYRCSLNEDLSSLLKDKFNNLLNSSSMVSLLFNNIIPFIMNQGKIERNNQKLDLIIDFIGCITSLEAKIESSPLDKIMYDGTNKTAFMIIDKAVRKPDVCDVIKFINHDAIPIKHFNDYLSALSNLTKFIRLFKKDLIDIKVDASINKDDYICDLIFKYEKYDVSYDNESLGIKKLIDLYYFFRCKNRGGIVFIDELDTSLNSIYLQKILNCLANTNEGQLCFTAQSTDSMDVLKNFSKSIDFLTFDKRIESWIKNGNYSPSMQYKNCCIKSMKCNFDSDDLINCLGGHYYGK